MSPRLSKPFQAKALPMFIVLETVLFVFGLVGLGTLAGWFNYLRAETGDALTDFAVRVALPLLLFSTIASADFGGAVPWRLWLSYFTAVAVAWTAGHLIVTRGFKRTPQAGVVGGVSAAFSNLLLLGIPFTQGVFGPAGIETLSLLIAVHLPAMLMASILLFQFFGRQGGEARVRLGEAARTFLRRIGTSPLIWGIVLGFVWRFTGFPLPSVAGRIVAALAGIAGPLALFAMGLSLRRYGLSGTLLPALGLSAVKLALMPAVTLGMALLLRLPPDAARVIVCAAALPAGVNSYLIAVQFGTGQALASNVMTLATAGAVVSVSGWLLVLGLVYG